MNIIEISDFNELGQALDSNGQVIVIRSGQANFALERDFVSTPDKVVTIEVDID